ncbi:uncharacterized protein LOC128962802 [Oppia nitens]|uniref:uncharacterized protein LOC128962802 n=1 Tax=Oppia nitens TaxID=1686743 RepID=UPI0023DCCEDF|nr:uncharacterized protein LOC128962802 [Oppia nitens]
MTTMNAICLIALLVSIIAQVVLVVVVKSKNFCKEYHRNGQKIDFAYRMNELDGKFFFIGNTYWKLKYIDGSDDTKTVTINNESDGESNFITGDNYSMVWCNWFNKTDKPTIVSANHNHCRVAGLKKNLKTIDWAFVNFDTLRLIEQTDSTNIDFEANFKPQFVWLPQPFRFRERLSAFWSNSQTIVYNFYEPNNPVKGIPSIVGEDIQRLIINGTKERKLNIELMTIVGQYSLYDNNGVSNPNSINGQGSIVFTNENQIIRYCYVGQPFNETACKPSNMKKLIDCSLDTKSSSSKTMIMIILVVVIVVLVVIIVGLIIFYRKYVGQGGDGEVTRDGSSVSATSNVSNGKLRSSRSAKSKPTKGTKTISPSKTGGSTDPTKSPSKAKTSKAK